MAIVRNKNEIEHDIEKIEEKKMKKHSKRDEENMFDFDISFGLEFPRMILNSVVVTVMDLLFSNG